MSERKSVVEVSQVPPVLLNKHAAARALGDISVDTLMNLVRAGEINAKQIGSRVMFEVTEIHRFAAELPSWEPRSA